MYNPLTSQKNRFGTLILTAVLTLSLLGGPLLGFLPPAAPVCGATHTVTVENVGETSATQGESDVSVRFKITNGQKEAGRNGQGDVRIRWPQRI